METHRVREDFVFIQTIDNLACYTFALAELYTVIWCYTFRHLCFPRQHQKQEQREGEAIVLITQRHKGCQVRILHSFGAHFDKFHLELDRNHIPGNTHILWGKIILKNERTYSLVPVDSYQNERVPFYVNTPQMGRRYSSHSTPERTRLRTPLQ